MTENNEKDIFDNMQSEQENYAEKIAEDLKDCAPAFRSIIKGTQIAAKLAVATLLLTIAAISLVISSCIKYLFFN